MSQLPAATIAEGVLGLEAEHVWAGFFVLNSNNVIPRYRLTKITGLRSKADTDDSREPISGSLGERPFPGQLRGKTVVYQGVIEAYSVPSMRAAENDLLSVMSDMSTETSMTIRPPAGRGGVEWTYWSRCLACDIPEEQTRDITSVFPHAREFTITLRMGDPRFYGAQVNGNGASGQTLALENLGNAPSDPTITLLGPVAAPITIERVNPDARNLVFADSIAWAVINAGKSVVVQFGRTPSALSPQTGGDFSPFITFASNYWNDSVYGILPGAQNIKVTGAAWSIAFSHAIW